MDMKPAGRPEQAACGDCPKSHFLRMLVCNFFSYVKDRRELIGLRFIVTSHLGMIRNLLHSRDLTLAHKVICLYISII